jgi:hypothetical protein
MRGGPESNTGCRFEGGEHRQNDNAPNVVLVRGIIRDGYLPLCPRWFRARRRARGLGGFPLAQPLTGRENARPARVQTPRSRRDIDL